jgi:glucose-6-phosphate dehydrogenase assembly protein OpcA
VIRDASVREIERELNRIRAESAESGAATQRTSVMTHIAWVPARWLELATGVLQDLGERLPSRALILVPRPEEERSALDAEVDLRCFARGGAAGAVCYEVVNVSLLGERAHHPGSVVEPLLLPDLPVFLRWRGPPPFGEQPFEELTGLADRLVVDSREWTNCEEDFGRMSELFDTVAVSDIAWARTQPWREALAALWPDVAEAATLRVAGPEPEALLLARWLSTCLGRDVGLDHEPAGEIELVEVDGRSAEPLRTERGTSADLLSEQLEVFGRDRVYEETVRSFSSVRT